MITTAAFLALALQCAPDVHPDTLRTLTKTESGFNPYAIGVVGGDPLARQPRTEAEARAAMKVLDKAGLKYSLGISQVYVGNLNKSELETIFEPCKNLSKGAAILKDCYARAVAKFPADSEQDSVLKSFSCYYSNNFTTGFKKEKSGTSYVDRIVSNSLPEKNSTKVPAINPNQTKEGIEEEDKGTAPQIDSQNQPPKPSPKHWDIYQDFKANS